VQVPSGRARPSLEVIGYRLRSTASAVAGRLAPSRSPSGIFLAGALLAVSASRPALAAELPQTIPPPIQRSLDLEDWPAFLRDLTRDSLTKAILRLATVRALFETGRLPDEQFAWIHSSGSELFSTADLKQHVGTAYLAETLLELGHLNAAERLFLNRLESFPEHRAWADQWRGRLDAGTLPGADPVLSRIRTNLITRDVVAMGFTTERLLRQALDANPANQMAFQFLMAHQLLERRLLYAVRTLVTSPQARVGPLPRHYAEAVLLHRQLYPGIPPTTLLPRVPREVEARFGEFTALMSDSSRSSEEKQLQAWRGFGDTYWYYSFFGSHHRPERLSSPGSP